MVGCRIAVGGAACAARGQPIDGRAGGHVCSEVGSPADRVVTAAVGSSDSNDGGGGDVEDGGGGDGGDATHNGGGNDGKGNRNDGGGTDGRNESHAGDCEGGRDDVHDDGSKGGTDGGVAAAARAALAAARPQAHRHSRAACGSSSRPTSLRGLMAGSQELPPPPANPGPVTEAFQAIARRARTRFIRITQGPFSLVTPHTPAPVSSGGDHGHD